ncbi:MAG: 23S rRNA (pseudouridine(1915)-N(3))-methyltransferase RlmH [Pelagibacterales bacterium]|nr:23S rRNA (pseudouridine(1915)-N(3))-methyltransferase RlmH [Pelagibacterales bacterium]
MKISIISIGKFENSPFKQVFETYLKRLKWKIELKELDLKNSHNFSIEKIKESEADLIIKNLKPNSKVIVLDEHGKQFGSIDFAKMLSDFAVSGDSDLTFIIGGANGLGKEILQKSQIKISLGKMTFPHMMVRVILIEQLYRAQSIIEGHPYHRE